MVTDFLRLIKFSANLQFLNTFTPSQKDPYPHPKEK